MQLSIPDLLPALSSKQTKTSIKEMWFRIHFLALEASKQTNKKDIQYILSCTYNKAGFRRCHALFLAGSGSQDHLSCHSIRTVSYPVAKFCFWTQLIHLSLYSFLSYGIWDIHSTYRDAAGVEGEDVYRMGRLFTVVLSLLGCCPVLMVLTVWHICGGLCPFVLKEYFDLKGRNCHMKGESS